MPDRNGYIGRAPADSAVTVARQSFNVSGVTTDFTFSSGYVPGYFDIYINGVKQIEGSDYTSSDSSTFHILNGGADDGDVIEAVAYKAFNAAAVTNASDLTVSGNLTVNGTATFAGAGTSVGFARTAFNLSGSPDITVRNITGVGATFTGVITYEDVTNVDSVGVVTARSGLVVNAGGANIGGGLTVTGVSTFFNNVQFGTAGVGGTITPAGNAEFTGIVTASDGRLIAGVGINSAGAIIGTGITTLNFIGTGNTFAVNGTTMDISIQSGSSGGGDSLDVTASLFI
tara:strand:- start:6 stop:863 length:858 start_codon:yes stop_codon:yes gene_type:complete